MSRRFDVVVAGGGVAGAAVAALLADRNLNVAVVERRRPVAPDPAADFDPRVVAISPGSQRILNAAGGWKELPAERIAPYRQMAVHARAGCIEFAASEHGLEQLGWIVEIPWLQAALWRSLECDGRVTLLAPAAVESFGERADGVDLALDNGDALRCRLLVAADGARSRLRRAAGIECEQWHYNQQALVAHIETQRPNEGLAWQRFTDYGPLALLPLPDGRSSIVWSLPARRAAELRAMDPQEFLDQLNACQDSPFGTARATGRRFTLPLVHRRARRLVGTRLALVGDAARTVHPLAGQGLNLGLMDAGALAEVLQRWSTEQDPAAALQRYERWRLSSGSLVAGGIHAINELTAGNPLGRQAAGLGLGLANRAWPLKEILVSRACGIDRDSPQLARQAP